MCFKSVVRPAVIPDHSWAGNGRYEDGQFGDRARETRGDVWMNSRVSLYLNQDSSHQFLNESLDCCDLLLSHPLQCVEWRLHVSVAQTHQQTIVFNTNLIHGLAAALLQTPLQLRGQMFKPVLGGVNQLQLKKKKNYFVNPRSPKPKFMEKNSGFRTETE